MKKQFYTHLIEVESLIVELDSMHLSEREKIHLAGFVDANIHNTILDAILSELSEHDKKLFLHNLQENDHQNIWNHLNAKIENIEEKIKKAADEIKKELREDIRQAHKLKKDL